MANIGVTLSAFDLLTSGQPEGDYGDHLTFKREDDKLHLFEGDELLATSTIHAAFVHVEKLNPITVPYVNRFIEHTSQRVEKNWRTKQYRVIAVDRKGQPGPDFGVNAGVAKVLDQAIPRALSEAEQMRSIGSLFIRAAEILEAAERDRLLAEQESLKGGL